MTQNAADDYAEISKHLKEIERRLRKVEGIRHSTPAKYGIWSISDRKWIHIFQGAWMLAGIPPVTIHSYPTLYTSAEEAQVVINQKRSSLVYEVREYPGQ